MRRGRRGPLTTQGEYVCTCSRTFKTYTSLVAHYRVCPLRMLEKQAEAATPELHAQPRHAEQAPVQQGEERKRARDGAIDDDRMRRVCLALADERYLKLTPSVHVDRIKDLHAKLIKEAQETMLQELSATIGDETLELVRRAANKHLDLYKGLRTAKQERSHLQTLLDRPKFHARNLSDGGVAYDFEMSSQLLLLLKHSTIARQQFHDTLTSWRTVHQYTRDDPKRIFSDIMDGDVARDHEVLGDDQRLPLDEATEAAKEGPYRFGVVIWADGFVVSRHHCPALLCNPFPAPLPLPRHHATHAQTRALRAQRKACVTPFRACTRPRQRVRVANARVARAQPVNHQSGQAIQHGTLVICYIILNFEPWLRMNANAIQLLTVVNEQDAKRAGMNEVFNGGSTSAGAQLRKLQTPEPARVRALSGGLEDRGMSIYAMGFAADYPQYASQVPMKGSTSAYRYDRKSTIDQRFKHYGEPFSLLQPEKTRCGCCPPSDWPRRLTYRDISDALQRAKIEPRIDDRKEYLTDRGINYDDYEWLPDGRVVDNFALSSSNFPYSDWLNGNTTDKMHTTYQGGTASTEAALQQYVNIRLRGYYTRAELNAAKTAQKLPPGHYIPNFGKYIEEGTLGNLPKPDAHLRFTSAETRHWLEHGTAIMESIFRRKVTPTPTPPGLHCWPDATRPPHPALRVRFAFCVARAWRTAARVGMRVTHALRRARFATEHYELLARPRLDFVASSGRGGDFCGARAVPAGGYIHTRRSPDRPSAQAEAGDRVPPPFAQAAHEEQLPGGHPEVWAARKELVTPALCGAAHPATTRPQRMLRSRCALRCALRAALRARCAVRPRCS